jgi:hypothetical protein
MMTKHIATIRIGSMNKKDVTSGILERISDLAVEHDAEDDASNLVYTMEDDNLDELREDAVAFRQALQKFFTDASLAGNPYITYSSEETT